MSRHGRHYPLCRCGCHRRGRTTLLDNPAFWVVVIITTTALLVIDLVT